jgi:hypothetical protein
VLIIGRDLFLHAAKSHNLLTKAIQSFEEYLQKPGPPNAREYYQARHFLREGQSSFDKALEKARLLLGPMSPYSPQDIEKQRAQFLLENKIIVQGLTLGSLQEELTQDEFLKTFFSSEEVSDYIESHFISQSSGKRKLANIKMRMILDKLQELSAKGRELQAVAQKHFQGGPRP